MTPYWSFIEKEATALKSDGCTLVSELFHICCLEHDCAYKLHKDPRDAYRYFEQGCTNYWDLASPISRGEADKRFRKCMQERSKLGRFSPVSWLRWVGVRVGASRAWN